MRTFNVFFGIDTPTRNIEATHFVQCPEAFALTSFGQSSYPPVHSDCSKVKLNED